MENMTASDIAASPVDALAQKSDHIRKRSIEVSTVVLEKVSRVIGSFSSQEVEGTKEPEPNGLVDRISCDLTVIADNLSNIEKAASQL